MMRRKLAAIASATCAALTVMLVGAGPAMGGGFTVASCMADPLNFSTSAFANESVTRGMKIRRACGLDGESSRGIITMNIPQKRPVPHGTSADVRITAPLGTSFTGIKWAGRMRRGDCRWAVELYADLPNGGKHLLRGLNANRNCADRTVGPQDEPYQTTLKRMKLTKTIPIPNGTRIVQRVICRARRGGKACPSNRRSYIRTFATELEVVDQQAPIASTDADTPLAAGEWVGGSQLLRYHAYDNVGVRRASAIAGGRDGGRDVRDCQLATPQGAFAQPTPCPNGPGQITANTKEFPEGTQQLVVQAHDSAGNPGSSAPVTARIDNTAPTRVDATVAGGDQWRNRNDFAVAWTNPEENDRAPIVAATAKLCAATDGASCSQAEHTSADISGVPIKVASPGEWKVSVWRRDAAGNQNADLASVPVTLRYDPEPPQLGFEPSPAGDPTAVSVKVTDPISGMADGRIEISRAGSETWQTLATQKEAGRLTAKIDDAALPAGNYLLRATARDQANNEGSTTQRLDGQPMAVTLPLRITTAMAVGIEGKRTERRVVRVRGKRRTIRRRVSVLRPVAGVVFGRTVQVRGRLNNRDGQGIADAEVQVLSRSDASAEQLVAVLRTDAAGNYAYTAAGSASRVLRFAYAGTPLTLPAQGEVQLRVPARSTLRVNRPRVLNGQSVRFDGRVRTLPVPAGGKLVELQVLLGGRWQTFRTGRTDQAGRWRLSYGFARTRTDQRFRFRVKLPRESGYPYASGGSSPLDVFVRGR